MSSDLQTLTVEQGVRAVSSRDRSELVPEGHYRAGPDIQPGWLAGRLILVEHEEYRGLWCVFARVLRRGSVTCEAIERWDAVEQAGPHGWARMQEQGEGRDVT